MRTLSLSDYDKGVVTPRILTEVLPLAYNRIPVLIDPKIRNLASYRPATLVTPNHHEALRMMSWRKTQIRDSIGLPNSSERSSIVMLF